jgi:hypothetical protein
MTTYNVPQLTVPNAPQEIPLLRAPHHTKSNVNQQDTVIQNTISAPLSVVPGVSFDGLAYSGYIPPGPNIAVSASYLVEGFNIAFAAYNKSGGLID